MNEFHGWLVIREKSGREYIDRDNQMSIIKDIQNRVDNFYYDNCFITLKPMYQSFHLIVSGETKRNGVEAEEVKELYRYISVIASGSYGLLYIRDECGDEFTVIRIARGRLEEMKDSFLSPCIPVIEE